MPGDVIVTARSGTVDAGNPTVVQISGESYRLKDKRRAGPVARPKEKG